MSDVSGTNDGARVVIVSGGSRGLGGALVRGLLAGGDIVATFSREATPLVEAWRRDDPAGERFLWQPIDATDHAATRRFVLDVARRYGRVDALVNNAGLAVDGVLPLMAEADIHRMVGVNLEGSIALAQAAARAMLPRGAGSIINVSSIVGLRGYAGLAAYGATKAGLDGLTRGLARELGPRGIRVNSVAPGYLDTEMSEQLSGAQRGQIVRRTPLGRLGTTDDVVGVVQFLLSPAAGFITGQTIVIDGGLTC